MSDDDQATERKDARRGIPTDPQARKEWVEEFTDDIMAGESGGIFVPWKKDRR